MTFADVTYDFLILNPNGKIYGGGTVSAWNGTAPPENLVQLAKGRVVFNFEAIDMPGLYTINLRVHDNIRHITIPLQRQLFLEP